MKKVNYLMTVLIAVALMSTSCEKENTNPDNLNPDNNALRITKIADNPAMIDPWWTFEYNDDGFVTKITGDEANDTIHVTYNNDDLPVQIVKVEVPYESFEYIYYDTIDISWGENSFTLNDDEYLDNETYTLDNDGRIIDIGGFYEARWQGDKAEIYYLNEGTEEWAQTRELTEYNHPLSAINLAILIACDISWIFDECEYTFQNKSCLSSNVSVDEGSAVYEYEYNKDGYPAQMEMYETTEKNLWMFYFEYETD